MQRTRWIGAGFLASALALTSCTSGPAGADAKQDPKAQLELWTRTTPGGPGEKATLRLVAGFEKATGHKVKVTAIFDDFETKLQQRAAQRNLPDIVMNDVTQIGAMHSQGLLREIDLGKIENSGDLIEQGRDSGKGVDGKQYGIPYSAQTGALLIRKDWREKLKLDTPKSWDDLAAMAEAFTTRDPDGNGKKDTYGLAAPLSTKRGYASWYFSNFLWAAGGDFITETGKGTYKLGDGLEGVGGGGALVPGAQLRAEGRPARGRHHGHPADERDVRGGQDGPLRRRPLPHAPLRHIARQGQVRGRPHARGAEGRHRARRGRSRLPDGGLGEPDRAGRLHAATPSPPTARGSACGARRAPPSNCP